MNRDDLIRKMTALLREAEEELAHIVDDDGSIAPLRRQIVAVMKEASELVPI